MAFQKDDLEQPSEPPRPVQLQEHFVSEKTFALLVSFRAPGPEFSVNDIQLAGHPFRERGLKTVTSLQHFPHGGGKETSLPTIERPTNEHLERQDLPRLATLAPLPVAAAAAVEEESERRQAAAELYAQDCLKRLPEQGNDIFDHKERFLI